MGITFRHVVAWTAALGSFAAVIAIVPAAGQPANMVATVRTPAVVPIARRSGPFLDLWVRAYTPPQRGAVEAVVAIRTADSGKDIEIGRFAVFPSEPFFAATPSQQRAYRFDGTAALSANQGRDAQPFAVVKLESVDPGVSAEDAKLTIDRAELSPRPAN